jgi:hypothetical protein
MNPPTVANDLPAWLHTVALPFAQNALVGDIGNGWVAASASCDHRPHTANVVVYSDELRGSWDVDNTPHNAHQKLAILAQKPVFMKGWKALVAALRARYAITGAGMILEFKQGVPSVDVYASTRASKKIKIRVLQGTDATASLDAFLDAFSGLSVS